MQTPGRGPAESPAQRGISTLLARSWFQPVYCGEVPVQSPYFIVTGERSKRIEIRVKSSGAIPLQTAPCQAAPHGRKWRVRKIARALALGIAVSCAAVVCPAQQDRDYSAPAS